MRVITASYLRLHPQFLRSINLIFPHHVNLHIWCQEVIIDEILAALFLETFFDICNFLIFSRTLSTFK